MAKDKKRLLRELRQKKYSCRPEEAEKLLRAWDFEPGGKQGGTQSWSYKEITLTLHAPHGKPGGNNLDPGAVAMVIRKVEEAEILQEREAKARRQDTNDAN